MTISNRLSCIKIKPINILLIYYLNYVLQNNQPMFARDKRWIIALLENMNEHMNYLINKFMISPNDKKLCYLY